MRRSFCCASTAALFVVLALPGLCTACLSPVAFAVPALLEAIAAPALAEIRTYTYGGSGEDFLVHLAVSEDGRIAMTGRSDSVDGTLSSRTKTGHSAWLLCVDAQGNVLTNFLTRHGARDCLRFPVFHGDGSLTAVLDADSAGEQELIRFDREGAILARTVIPIPDGATGLGVSGMTDEGYLFYEVSGETIIRHTLYDWDGRFVRDWNADEDPGYVARAERHVVRVSNSEGWLTAIDESGVEHPIAKVMAWSDEGWDVYLNALLSLEDGGAVAAGYASDENGFRSGYIARWDAQGKRVFEWWLPGEIPFTLERTPRGFAAAVCNVNSPNGIYEQALAFFDGDGIQTGSIPLGDGVGDCETATLPDGGIAVLILYVVNAGEEPIDLNARLVIVPPEDFL